MLNVYCPQIQNIYNQFCFRWLMMGIIGFSFGILGFLLHQIIDIISEFKWELTSFYIQKQDFPGAFTFTLGYSLIFLMTSCILVLYNQLQLDLASMKLLAFLMALESRTFSSFRLLLSSFSPVLLLLDVECLLDMKGQ